MFAFDALVQFEHLWEVLSFLRGQFWVGCAAEQQNPQDMVVDEQFEVLWPKDEHREQMGMWKRSYKEQMRTPILILQLWW